MSYEQSEEEQVEAFKSWWRKNGVAVIGGLALAVALSLGWQYWQGQKEAQAERAGQVFAEMSQALESATLANTSPAAPDLQKPRALAEQIINEFPESFYAELAALSLVRMDLESQQADAARARLEHLVEHAKNEAIRPLARLRLAHLQWGIGQADAALKTLEGSWPETYLSDADALRGDILVSQAQLDEARKAYDAALAQATLLGLETGLLRIKRDDLGGSSHATPAAQ
ncbi:MAG: tetratricopeptide repeat protein [Halothiobacillaceae bacterium]|nr:tetratricopeptide repeat protein [Halothiobacillaceae bacterium]